MILKKQIELGRLVWELRLYAARLGWPGCAGLALIVMSLLAVPTLLAPIWQESRLIQDNAQSLRERIALRNDIKQKEDPVAQLAEFHKSFPGSNSLADTLQSIYAAAASHNVTLSQGDYNLVSPDSGLLQRYEISLPVRARYTQVRNFLAQVLGQNKNVALLAVSLTRSTSTDIGVDAQLRFAVYVQDAP